MARVVTVLLLLMLPAVVPAAAQEPKKLDPVIVTGTKIETPAEQVGATVTVIEGDEIETRLYPTVDEALRNVPGVEIRRSGSFGKTTSISIRGANPNQVQILVDGVRVKSPTMRLGRPGRHRARVDRADRDHPRAPVDDLRRRCHRRRGADHHQEGAAGRPPAYASQEVGNYDTYRAKAGLSGAWKAFDYSLGYYHLESNGLTINDGMNQNAVAGRFGLDLPWGNTRIGGAVRYNKTDTGVPIEFVGNPTADRADDRSQHEPGERDVHGERQPAHAAGELVGGRDPRVPLLEQAVLHRSARSLHVPAGDLRPALRFPRHLQDQPERGGGAEPLPPGEVEHLHLRHRVAGGARQRAGHQRRSRRTAGPGRGCSSSSSGSSTGCSWPPACGWRTTTTSARRPPSAARSPTS